MVYGIGHDIVCINRIQRLIKRYKHHFYNKVLSESEQLLFPVQNIEVFIAKKFVAKEAFAKACGIGLRKPIYMKNITITNDQHGKPQIIVHNDIQEWLTKQNIKNIFVSISDEVKCLSYQIASAFVILEF